MNRKPFLQEESASRTRVREGLPQPVGAEGKEKRTEVIQAFMSLRLVLGLGDMA